MDIAVYLFYYLHNYIIENVAGVVKRYRPGADERRIKQIVAFVCGKEARDLLLPPTCLILSIQKNTAIHVPSAAISAGDVLHVHFQTYHPTETMRQLEAMVGPQSKDLHSKICFGNANEPVPEL